MKEILLRQPVWENGKMLKWAYWGKNNGRYQLPVNDHESYLFTGFLVAHVKLFEGDIIRKEESTTDKDIRSLLIVVWIAEWAMFALLDITSGEYSAYKKSGVAGLDETETFWTYTLNEEELSDTTKCTNRICGNILTTPELTTHGNP